MTDSRLPDGVAAATVTAADFLDAFLGILVIGACAVQAESHAQLTAASLESARSQIASNDNASRNQAAREVAAYSHVTPVPEDQGARVK